jgi:hypothetical protein
MPDKENPARGGVFFDASQGALSYLRPAWQSAAVRPRFFLPKKGAAVRPFQFNAGTN